MQKENLLVRLFRRIYPVSEKMHGERFFVREDGRRVATPLFVTLLAIETSDVIFAVDSIPAIFSVSRDTFIILTSNIFAILGLRSLYFALAALSKYFSYLKYGIALILVFIGIKMLLGTIDYFNAFLAMLGVGVTVPQVEIPTSVSLAVIFGVLLCSVALSLSRGRQSQ